MYYVSAATKDLTQFQVTDTVTGAKSIVSEFILMQMAQTAQILTNSEGSIFFKPVVVSDETQADGYLNYQNKVQPVKLYTCNCQDLPSIRFTLIDNTTLTRMYLLKGAQGSNFLTKSLRNAYISYSLQSAADYCNKVNAALEANASSHRFSVQTI